MPLYVPGHVARLSAGAPALVVFDGQSHNLVGGLDADGSGAFPQQLMAMPGLSNIPFSVRAVGGQSWTTLSADPLNATYRVDPLGRWPGKRIIVLTGGTQDVLEGDTGNTILTQMVNYAVARRAAGFDAVLYATIPPATAFTAPQEAERDTANALFRLFIPAAQLIDTDLLLPDPTDTDKYLFDEAHWTEEGALDVATAAYQKVLAAVYST